MYTHWCKFHLNVSTWDRLVINVVSVVMASVILYHLAFDVLCAILALPRSMPFWHHLVFGVVCAPMALLGPYRVNYEFLNFLQLKIILTAFVRDGTEKGDEQVNS